MDMMTMERVRTAPPVGSFQITMYALTRPTKNGGTEFATKYEGWSSNINKAHMLACSHLVNYTAFNGIDKKDSETSEVVFTIDVYNPVDFPDASARANTTSIIVAWRTDSTRNTIGKPAEMVTHCGGIGHNNQITDDVLCAIPLESVMATIGRDWNDVSNYVRKTTSMPRRNDKGRLTPIAYDFFPAIRRAVIMPVPQG